MSVLLKYGSNINHSWYERKVIDSCMRKCIYYIGDSMYQLKDALYAASVLDVTFDKYTAEEFLDGINIELEHGTVNPKTNVTNDNLITTAKIALAHLNEFPNYYNKEYGLRKFEKMLQSKLTKKM